MPVFKKPAPEPEVAKEVSAPKPISTLSDCEAAMEAKHVEIAELKAKVSVAHIELDSLLQIHRRLLKG